MVAPDYRKLKLAQFQKGLDNAHIDVLLDPVLTDAVSDLVQAGLNQELRDLSLRDGGSLAPETGNVSEFTRVHHAVSLRVDQLARNEARRELVQLYQLSLVKCILTTTDKALQMLRAEMVAGRDDAEAFSGGNSVQHRDRLSLLAMQQLNIRYRVCSQVFRVVRKMESSELRKLRKSTIGISWPVSESMLFNPLLLLGGVGSEASFLSNYPFIFHQPDRFERVNGILTKALSAWLPDYLGFPSVILDLGDYSSLLSRHDTGQLPGYADVERYLRQVMAPVEYEECRLSWLDEPDNLMSLLGGDRGDWPERGSWRNPKWAGFQRGLLNRLDTALAKEGLDVELYASAQMPQLVQSLGLGCPIQPVYEYLTGQRSRKVLQQQLQKLRGIPDLDAVLSKIEQIRQGAKQMPEGLRQQTLVSMLGGFARLRHDLKSAWNSFRAMNGIHLLEDKEDIALSRSNDLLNEFSASEGQLSKESKIVGHVIIKADLRGSTRLAASMCNKDLNPAAYFSQNLFNPINTLLERYGATKVFIEGDAVILMIPEYAGYAHNGMVVARACGLSNRILDVVKKRNVENRHLGLPELELGIGIAYIDESPTYLFDEGRKITLSPAINRADRLSSSAIALHGIRRKKGRTGWGVEVTLPANCVTGLSGQLALQRYNVNGIELDTPAFAHLLNELVMKKVKASGLGGGNAREKYYIGRFPDMAGKNEWLMVREARVHIWEGDAYGKALKPSQKFYEVVSDGKLQKRMHDKLSGLKGTAN